MGNVITFCSPMHGLATTANLIATAISLVEDYDKKVLLMQTHFTMNNLQEPLIGDTSFINEELFYQNTGIDTLMRLYKSGNIGMENIKNATIAIGKEGNLSVLAGTRQKSREVFETENGRAVLKAVIGELKNYYDEVLIDTNAGFYEQTQDAIEKADKVVLNLRQNKLLISDALANEKFRKLTENKDVYYCFGAYSPESKLTLNNMRKIFKEIKGNNSGVVGFSSMYMDAISDCDAFNKLVNAAELAQKSPEDGDSWWEDIKTFAGMLK